MSNQRTPRCSRCGRQFHPGPDADAWNAVFEKGVIVGYLCGDCQSPEENAEAVVHEATLTYGADSQGRAVGVPKTDPS